MVWPRHSDSTAEMAMEGMEGMEGMDDAHSSSSMHMGLFQTDMATPLYSEQWTPTTAGAYAGTILFLIALGVVLRLLIAGKALAEARWLDQELKRRYVVVEGRQQLAKTVSEDSLAKRMTLTENGVEEGVMVVQKKHAHVRPWRLSVDPVRALLDTLLAGVGYLLMLAVMTMNVGYFLAVLAGTFLGSLLVGRYNLLAEGGH